MKKNSAPNVFNTEINKYELLYPFANLPLEQSCTTHSSLKTSTVQKFQTIRKPQLFPGKAHFICTSIRQCLNGYSFSLANALCQCISIGILFELQNPPIHIV